MVSALLQRFLRIQLKITRLRRSGSVSYTHLSLIEVPDGQQWIIDMIQNILIEVLSSIAEQERITIRKRQKEGIEVAKAKGKHLGRPKINQPEEFRQDVYKRQKHSPARYA